jgi:hypothetical protein
MRKVERFEPCNNLFRGRRREARLRQDGAQRVDIASRRRSACQRGFQHRGPSPHERVIHHVARHGESIDEEPRKLRLETGAVGNLVKAVGGSLLARPELVDDGFDQDWARPCEPDARDAALCRPPVPLERAELANDRRCARR